jgi:hypothetical protein
MPCVVVLVYDVEVVVPLVVVGSDAVTIGMLK